MRKHVSEEFESFKNTFSSHIIFLANDDDKKFYNAMEYSYTINPDNPADYRYKIILYETNIYNFNFNYNSDLDMNGLWFNEVVRNSKMKPI